MTLHSAKGFGLRKIAVVASVAGMAAVGLTAPSAFASTSATPHLTPANTKIAGSSTKASFAGTVDSFKLTVNCTKFTSSGTTPKDGLTVPLSKAPTFSGCTDSLGGKDTVKTAGKWSLVANSTGSKITIHLPVKAATFTSSLVSGCTLTIDPTKVGTIVGTYNNKNTLTITKSSFAIKGTGCSSGATASVTESIKFTPGVKVVS